MTPVCEGGPDGQSGESDVPSGAPYGRGGWAKIPRNLNKFEKGYAGFRSWEDWIHKLGGRLGIQNIMER